MFGVLPNGEKRCFQRIASLLVGTLCLVSRILRCLFAPLILLVVDKIRDRHDGLLTLLERLRLGLLKDLKLRLHQHHALGQVGTTGTYEGVLNMAMLDKRRGVDYD